MSDIKTEKAALRENWKKNYPRDPAIRAQLSEKICKNLIAEERFQRARHIALYAAREWEVDLLPLLKLHPRSYAFPKVFPTTKKMEFHCITGTQELQPGTFGILEPKAGKALVSWDESDLFLVPGYAFDRAGIRIGSGAGYYDRFFPTHLKAARWGICFSAQYFQETLAHTAQDVRMGSIVTEQGFFPCLTSG